MPNPIQDTPPMTIDEILERVYLYGMNGGLGYGKFENELSPKEAKQQIQALITEARIDAVYSMHDSIMRGELQWDNIREDAWLNGTIHKWIDRVIESGDTTSTSRNGKWLQNHIDNPTKGE